MKKTTATEKKTTSTATTVKKKIVEELAKEVIAGKWSAGDERKQKLTTAGYDYNAVQKKVNKLMAKPTLKSMDEIAKEVIQVSGVTVTSVSRSLPLPDMITARCRQESMS